MAIVLETWIPTLCMAVVTTLVALPLFARIAPSLGLVDHPGGRKSHARAVPLVGGLAIFLALAVASAEAPDFPLAFALAAAVLVSVGAIDDVVELGPLVRFLAQFVASSVMVLLADVELKTLGDLIGNGAIGLWVFAFALTLFATIGVINSLNMLDGMDGLAGVISAIAFIWYGLCAYFQSAAGAFALAGVSAAAVGVFLLFNMRMPWQPQARIFLGDAGSMLLGFALAWLAIDLTQGAGRTLPPICALWIVLLPLADCVSLMTRRIRAGLSPFAADNRHIHHYLQARGFTPQETLAILASLSFLFGAVGFFGWRLGIPENYLFWTFFFLYFGYHFWIQRAWKRLDQRAQPPIGLLADEEDEVLPAS